MARNNLTVPGPWLLAATCLALIGNCHGSCTTATCTPPYSQCFYGAECLGALQSNLDWVLNSGTAITTQEYRLAMQTDGNLVLYGSSGAIWATGTNQAGSHFAVQADGNLVVYNTANVAVWASNTRGVGKGPYYLFILDDSHIPSFGCNLLMIDSTANGIWNNAHGPYVNCYTKGNAACPPNEVCQVPGNSASPCIAECNIDHGNYQEAPCGVAGSGLTATNCGVCGRNCYAPSVCVSVSGGICDYQLC